MNRSIAITPSINHALDRVLGGSSAGAAAGRVPLSRQRFGVDILGLLIWILMLGAYLLA